MSKLVSRKVKRTPQSGIRSDRYQFLDLEQSEPNLGDPLVGPSSIGANPIKAGTFYQLAAIAQYPGERFWSSPIGIGTTLGIISVYANNELPNSAFSRIHGLNFVGSGVTLETPPLELLDGIGIATVRFTVTDILNQGPSGQVLYNGPNGFALGSTDLNYYNNNIGIGTSLPNSKLEVIGNAFISGVVTASNFSGTATTAINVSGGIASVTSLNVSGVSTLGNIQISSGIVTATTGTITYYGDLVGSADYATIAGIAYTIYSDYSGFSTSSGISTSVVGGIASVNQLNVSGITTLGVTSTTQLTSQYLNVSGVSTLGFITSTDAFYTGVVTATRFYGTLDGFVNNAGYALTSGISTNVIGGIASVTQLNVTGISTLTDIYVNNTISGPSTIYIDPAVVGDNTGKVVIRGDLEVKGSTTTIESQTLTIVDKNIELASNSTTDSFSDGGGITLKGTVDHTITFTDIDDSWQFSENLTPISDNTKDLGTLSKKWKSLYVNNVYSDNISSIDLNISGISTLGTLKVSSGILTSTSGIITYYGDGSNLIGVIATYASTAGIATNAINAGYASTAGISTVSQGLTGTPDVQVGIITATEYYGVFKGTIDNGVILDKANYANTAGIATNVIGGISSVSSLNVTGIATINQVQISSGTVSAPMLEVGSQVSIGFTTFTTTSNTIQSIFSGLSTSVYRSVEFLIQASEGANFQIEKIVTIHDGTITYDSEYGVVINNSLVANYFTDISGENIRLLTIPASTNNTEHKISYTAIKI